MATLSELRTQRDNLLAQARRINSKAEAERRDLTSEEQDKFNTLMGDISRLNNEIRMIQEGGEGWESRSRGTLAAQYEGAAYGSPAGGFQTRQQNPEHTKTFEKFLRTGDDRELRDFRALVAGEGPEGGFMIPVEMDRQIDEIALLQSAMRNICEVRPITTPEYQRLMSVHGTGSGWVGETEARPETATPEVKAIKPHWGTLYAYPMVTADMLDFAAYDVTAFLTNEVGEKFSQDQGTAFISGDGIKKPRGILDFPFTSDVDTVRPFGTLRYIPSMMDGAISFDSLWNTVFSLKRGYRKGSLWLMNSTTAASLSKIKNGEGEYIWQNAVQLGQPPTLLGYPVELDDFMPDIDTDVIPIMFGNFMKGYMIVDLPSVLTLRDPFTNKPYVGFYFARRMGSLLKNSEAIRGVKASLV
ncbi:MAG: phage major capsid protein [Desulfobaccales bacterium]